MHANTTTSLAGQDTNSPSEDQLKAVYLYNFLNYVHWPEEKCEAPAAKLREIAVLGAIDLFSFNAALQTLQSKLNKDGKSLPVVYLGPYKDGMDLSGCRLLFVSNAEKKNYAKILAQVTGEPVLTVADSEEFIEAGGMLTLISRQNNVRWVVNRKTAEQAGLRVNSRLLAMAIMVID